MIRAGSGLVWLTSNSKLNWKWPPISVWLKVISVSTLGGKYDLFLDRDRIWILKGSDPNPNLPGIATVYFPQPSENFENYCVCIMTFYSYSSTCTINSNLYVWLSINLMPNRLSTMSAVYTICHLCSWNLTFASSLVVGVVRDQPPMGGNFLSTYHRSGHPNNEWNERRTTSEEVCTVIPPWSPSLPPFNSPFFCLYHLYISSLSSVFVDSIRILECCTIYIYFWQYHLF